MGKIKIYDIAKKLNLTSKEVLEVAKKLNINVKSHLSGIEEEEAKRIEDDINKKENKKQEKEIKKNEEEEENTNLDVLNTLKKNEILQVQNYELKDAETSPPSRYNSGNLVLAMENAGKLIEEEELREQIKGAGIGTSATRGEIIKKLEKIQYIQINSKTQIVTPTVKGEAIYDVVYQAMPDILNPKLTASWEKGLDMVAKKEIEPQVFMDKLENYIRSKFDKLVVKM